MTTPDNPFGPTDVPSQYRSLILASAERWGIHPALLAAQINQESSFDPNAKSSSGALGIAQFMPDTAREHGIDPLSPSSAIDGMAKLMHLYKQRFGTWNEALIAYHDGPNKVYSPSDNAKDYVSKILDKVGELVGESAGQGPDFIPDIPGVSNPLPGLTGLLARFKDADFIKRIGIFALGGIMVVIAVMVISGGRGLAEAKKIVGDNVKDTVKDGSEGISSPKTTSD